MRLGKDDGGKTLTKWEHFFFVIVVHNTNSVTMNITIQTWSIHIGGVVI